MKSPHRDQKQSVACSVELVPLQVQVVLGALDNPSDIVDGILEMLHRVSMGRGGEDHCCLDGPPPVYRPSSPWHEALGVQATGPLEIKMAPWQQHA